MGGPANALSSEIYLRAVVSVAAEEHGLPTVVSEPVLFQPLDVTTLGVVRPNAGVEILLGERGEISDDERLTWEGREGTYTRKEKSGL